ncbi:hypothetical protein WIW89_11125 [Stygiolobus sp. CP850M]|jgi:hypothetical protein|uniref:hypothetical protein n=2 Tax=Stygiolobus TaxID=41674 RepID=UPI00307F9F25
MVELKNDERIFRFVMKFIELREKLGDNLIKVTLEENKNEIVVYVRDKVDFTVEDIKFKSVKEELKERLTQINGVRKVIFEENKVRVFVDKIYPELFETVSVTVYEIGKEFGEEIEWKIEEIT